MTREVLVSARVDSFDVRSVRKDIEAIAARFGEYLARCGGLGRSKHSALGAVGKALRASRSLRGEALLGYARRIHEQTTGNSFPAGDVEALDEGLGRLDQLLAGQPARAAAEIVERVGHATYFDVRRRTVEFQRAWRDFAGKAGVVKPGEKTPWFSKKLGPEWEPTKKAFLEVRREEDRLAEAEWEVEE